MYSEPYEINIDLIWITRANMELETKPLQRGSSAQYVIPQDDDDLMHLQSQHEV